MNSELLIRNSELGEGLPVPPDALEVALLDAHTRTISVDISSLQPGTEATLYFDLLGFGASDSRVIIDDVRIIDSTLTPPNAQNDTATTTQAQTVTIDILANDTDPDSTIIPTSLQIGKYPTNGTLIKNEDGTISYTPGDRFAGTDTFTYVVQDTDGIQSNQATVSVEVSNSNPEIESIITEDKIVEGSSTIIKAIASDPGNDSLTYSFFSEHVISHSVISLILVILSATTVHIREL